MNWPISPLGELAEIVSGSTPKTNVPAYWNGDIPWVTPADLARLDGHYIGDTPRKLTPLGLRTSGAKLLPIGSVLFSSRAPIGHVAVTQIPMATNQGFKSFLTDPTKLEPKYLYWWLRSNTDLLQSLGVGATFKEVSKAIVARVKIPVPPLQEQRRIAAILDQTDALRAARRTTLSDLDDLALSEFNHLFGEPLASKSRWPIRRLQEVASKISDGTHHSPPIVPSGVPYITAKHLKSHGLDFEASPWYVSEDSHRAIYARCDPKLGDVLYIKDGATTGLAAVNRYDFEFSMLSSLALIRPNDAALTPEYLSHWLNHSNVRRHLLGGMSGAAIKRLTLAKIKMFEVPVPPLPLQRAFASSVRAIDLLREIYTAHLDKLDQLFASLQQRAFRGEL